MDQLTGLAPRSVTAHKKPVIQWQIQDFPEEVHQPIITARKRSLRRLCFFHLSVSHSVHRRGWYPSMPCSRSQGGGGWYPSMLCGFLGPHLGEVEDLARRVSRPTPKEEVEGDLARGVSRPTSGGISRLTPGGGSPGPHPKGKLRGIWPGGLQAHTPGVSRPTPQGGLQAHTQGVLSQHALRQTPPPPPTATAAGGTHPTGMHSYLAKCLPKSA